MDIEVCKPYKPKLKRLTEKRDLNSLSNLEDWCEEMCLAFDKDVRNQSSSDNKTLHWLINAYPLILAYQGKTQESELFLHRVIAYWSDKFLQDENNQNLINLIDPTINLLRLYKLTNQHSAYLKLMGEIAILDNTGKAKLGSINVTKEILGEQWEILHLAAIDEFLKFSLLRSNFNDVLNFKKVIPAHLKSNDVYIEANVTALMSLGKHKEAIQLSWKEISKKTCIKNGIYSYRLYEAFMGLGKQSKAKTVMKHLISNMEKTPLDSLSLLTFSSLIIETENLPPSSHLAKKTLNKYIEIKDEFNYGMTLCHLYKNYPDEDNKKKILNLYNKTGYEILKNRIESTLNIKKEIKKEDSINLKKISASINQLISKG
ncbi:hypothetical protein [Pseudoalteromonas distincta]|uniref:hypothetical protein n=1 Tax=Pseudoalteromonas distincta TaxID=77608 RepID=UPI0039E7FCA7